ncbi:MAG: hypothetical protein J1F67_07815 [Muribaculaceae bacterium]|nr:hypothetical protein [Muribaculaceae bacterium]
MKLTKRLFGFALTAIAAGAFVSCTNDLNEPGANGDLNNGRLSPIVAPDAVVWSGNQTFGNSFTGAYNPSTRALQTNENYFKITDGSTNFVSKHPEIASYWENAPQTTDNGELVSNAEKAYILRYLEDHPDEGSKECSLTTYFIQNVGSSLVSYTFEYIQNGSIHHTANEVGGTKMNNLAFGVDPEVDEFGDYNGTSGPRALVVNVPVNNPSYTDSYPDEKPRRYDAYEFYYIKYEGKTYCYLCFDYRTYKEDNGILNFLDGDQKYNDWVIKLIPANGMDAGPNVTGDEDPSNLPTDNCKCGENCKCGDDCECTEDNCSCPNCGDNIVDDCPLCPHEKHTGNCEKCDQGTICNPTDDTCPECKDAAHPGQICGKCEPGSPCNPENGNNGYLPGSGNGTNKYNNNEVEINLSLNDIHTLPDARAKYGIADLVSKLSIHVRYPHDVEVIIPVPESIYCDQDDLYILNDHYTDGAYGSDPNAGDHQFDGEEHILSYVVGDQPVDLIITYVAAKDDEMTPEATVWYTNSITGEQSLMKSGGYIRVRTSGIDEKVISYCREHFGDGINFEVYNYYNRGNMYTTGKYAEITFKDLQFEYLSRSMVNFDWQNPDIENKFYPDFYINAFNNTAEGNPYYGDCYVWIWGDYHATNNRGTSLFENTINTVEVVNVKGTPLMWRNLNYNDKNLAIQCNNFRLPYQGTHFNGSPFNWIYTANHVTGSVDSSDMPNENGSQWPFYNNGTNGKGNHYFRNGKLGNYWYYEFASPGNTLETVNPFRNAN